MELKQFHLEGAGSGLPLYQQLENMVAKAVEAGRLAAGDRMPSVRDLAAHLGVNAVTVSKAYRELARQGIVGGRGRGGTVVLGRQGAASAAAAAAAGDAPEVPPAPFVSGNRAFQYMLRAAHGAGVISLTKAYASAEAVMSAELRGPLLEFAATRCGPQTFDYTGADGDHDLRRALAEYFTEQGIACTDEEVLVTNGAQQALDVVARASLSPGDVLLMERPTYFGMLDLARSLRVGTVGIAMEPDGLSIEELGQALGRTRARALYVMPNFQNPSGITMGLAKRRALLELCGQHGTLVIEDDYAPELRFRGKALPSLYSLARGTAAQPFVCHVRSFNKSLLPGIRLGALLAPAPLREGFIASRGLSDLHSSNLVQAFALEFFRRGDPHAIAKRLAAHYAKRQKALADALRQHLPHEVSLALPEGGLNLWLRLPQGIDTGAMFYAAMANRVSYLAGDLFYPDQPDHSTMRISFGSGSAQELAEGAARLSATLKAQTSRRGGGISMVV